MRRWRAISGGDLWKRVQQGGAYGKREAAAVVGRLVGLLKDLHAQGIMLTLSYTLFSFLSSHLLCAPPPCLLSPLALPCLPYSLQHVHLVMDLCQGGDVWQRVQQGGAYGEREAAAVVGRLVGLLRDLHALGIMHRDVKPENVLLRREDDDVDVAVIDYGVSVFFNPGERFSEIVGSPFYIAPEVLHESYGPESDIWAAGVILFVLLSGVLPFWGDSDEGVFRAILEKSVEEEMEREGVWESVSDEAKDLVMRMLSKDAALRITADEILAGLICGRNDDYLGQSLPHSYFETHADVDSRDATSAPAQETPLLRISTASPVSPTPHPPSSPSPLSPCSLPLFTPPFCGPICFPPFCPPFLPPFPPPSPTPFSLFFPLPLSDATHYSKQQVPQRSSMKQKEGGGANELENGPLLVIVTRPPILPASLLPHSPSFSRHALQQVAGAAAIRLSEATHYSKQQVPQRSAVRRVEGGGAYELENVCIHARFKGGVTLHGVEDVPSDGDGLPLCNEAGCFTFPVTYTNDKLPRGKRGHSGWIDDATAVIMPLTAGNPWHFLHHAIPLSHVAPFLSAPFLSAPFLSAPFLSAPCSSTAHLFPCLARGVEGMLAHASHIHGEGRHEGTMPDVDTRTHDTDVQGIHTHDARTHGAAHITATGISVPPPDYYSTRHFPWWPLLAATAPPGVTLYQKQHHRRRLSSLVTVSEVAALAANRSSPFICYRHAFLGLPPAFSPGPLLQRRPPLLPVESYQEFRRRALALAGVTEDSSESKPHDLPHSTSSSLPSATSAPLSTSASLLPTRPPPRSTRPLMGIIARDRMRRLCHLPDLVRAAESAGFEVRVLQFEKFDVWQQIREAHQLDVLAGSHGAGMSNLIWLPPHAQVLEIYPARPTPFLLPAQNLNPASDYGRWASIFQVDHVVALQCPLQDEQCQVAEQVEDQVGTNVGEQRGGHVGVQVASLACFAIVSLAQQEPPSTGGGAIDPGAPIREKHRGVTAISEDINGQNLIPIHLDGSDPSVIESIASGGCKAGKCPEFHICEGTTPFGSGSGNFALCESKPLMTSAVEKTIQDMVFNLLSDAPPVSNCLDGSAIEKLRAGGASASHPPWFRTCPPQNPSAAGASSAAAAAAGAAGGSGKLESCVVPPYPGHVIMLRDVYVDLHGHVFNGTHRFVFGGGPRGSDVSGKPGEGVTSEFSYPKGTTAVSHRTMSHQLFGFDLASDVPFSHRTMSHQLFGFDLASDVPFLFGFDLASRALHAPPKFGQGGGDGAREAHPLFVHLLFVVALIPLCPSPSPSLLRLPRARPFLPLSFLPSFLPASLPLAPLFLPLFMYFFSFLCVTPYSPLPLRSPLSPSPPTPPHPPFPQAALVPLLRLPLPLSPPPGPRPPLPPPRRPPLLPSGLPSCPPLLPTLLLRSLTIDSHGNTRFCAPFLPLLAHLPSSPSLFPPNPPFPPSPTPPPPPRQPSFLSCASPSPSLLRLARARHFLPPDGLPSFLPSFKPHSPPPLFLSADGLSSGGEWLVVVVRTGLGGAGESGGGGGGVGGVVEEEEEIERVVVERFGAERVESYQGHMGMDDVKKLFNRARLLIGPSSLALSSLLFLPFNAALLELLPPPALNTSAPAGPGLALGPEGFGTLAAAVGIVRYAVPCGPHIATHSLLLSIPAPSICSITPGSVLDPEGFGTLAAAAGIVRYAVPCDPSLKGPAGGAAAGAAAESAGAAAAAGATGSAGTAGLGSSMSCRLQLVEGALDEIMSAHFSDVKRSGAVEGGAGGGTGGAAAASSSASSATPSLVPSPPPPSPAAAASPPPSTQPPPSAAAAAAAPPPPPPPPAAVVTHPTRSSPGSEKDEGPQPSPWYELNEQQWDEHREKIAAAEGGAGAFVTRLFNLTVPPEKDETEDGAGGGEGGAGGGVSEEGGGNQTAAGKSRAAPLFPDYSDHIPGTRLHTKRHVLIFNKWMECVLREGRWVFNATPRTLPWEYTGFMNMCDHKQVEKRKGKATWGADEMVLKGTSPDKWTVRETLKYEYLVPEDKCGAAALKKVVDAELGPEAASTGAAGAAGAEDTNAEVPVWKKFDGLDFCKRAAGAAETRRDRLWSNGSSAPAARDRWMDDPRRMHKGFTVYIVGDSLQNLFAATFLNHMLWHVKKSAAWALNRTICYQWVEHKPHVHCHMNFFNTSQDVCPGAFAGDAGSGGGGTGVAAAGAAGAAAADPAAAAAGGIGTNGSSSSDAGAFAMHFTSNRWLTVGDTFVAKESVPWSQHGALVDSDVLLINRGAHFTDDEAYVRDVRRALRFVRRNFPDKLIIYRNTPPGHFNCTENLGPLAERQPKEILPFNWGGFMRQNELARKLVEEVGGIYMDVEGVMALRPDGHTSWFEETPRDCLHYCTPGPMDFYAQFVYNILLHTVL
ncbi:unnamed protein product [Closterium sp. NIES-65]|nr:unnamed protein product [Closterium sp. NIES-65]